MKARCGYEPTSGLYYDALGEGRPVVFIHGGGGAGSHFRVTPDGRTGWADRLAERGFQCWVTDWPGCGRSGGRDALAIRYDDLVAGYAGLLALVDSPPVVVCHSMGGAVTWKLVELGLVERVVAIAASYPGNIQPAGETISDDGNRVRIRFVATGVEFEVARDRLAYYSDAYVFDQGIAGSRRFPREHLGPVPREPARAAAVDAAAAPGGGGRTTEGRAYGGVPRSGRPLLHGYRGPAHTPEIEERTLELLRSWGADAHLHWLDGNGHFLYLETNSDEILEQVVENALS